MSGDAGDIAALQEELGDGVALLVDEKGEAVDAFGMRDPAPKPAKGQPRTGAFFIDREGVIRQRWLPKDMAGFPAPAEILERIR